MQCLAQKMPVPSGYCLTRESGRQVRRTGHASSLPERLERSITLKRKHVRNCRAVRGN